MFQRRLAWLWGLLTALALAIVVRLAQIQVVQAEDYTALAERILTRPVRYIHASRGSILDRNGRVLLRDEPAADVSIHYAVLAGERSYLQRAAQAARRNDPALARLEVEQIVDDWLAIEIPHMWNRLALLSGRPRAELLTRADEVRARVDRVHDAVRARSPDVRRIAEQDSHLPILQAVDNRVALAIRRELERYPWLVVEPSTRRVAHAADSVSHLLGRLGAASPERIADDPLRGDELRQLRPEDWCGVSGIERVAELTLRGRRGRILEDYGRDVLQQSPPIAGQDVTLTLDLNIQEYVLAALTRAVEGEPGMDPPGGLPPSRRSGAAAVVIEIATREVRALVSYPGYRYGEFAEQYGELLRDAERDPTMFRAVRAQYPPGSICKAITLVGGLAEGVITPDTRFHCTGHLLPGQPDRFRCWIYQVGAGGITHDMVDNPAGQDAVAGIRNSCNIYFFRVGERLGPQRLCNWFEEFGLGRSTGTGLIEESGGIVPTASWLERVAGRGPQTADAWNWSIGQGEVTITPLQAANVAASIAAGFWTPVRLAYDERGQTFGAPVQPPRVFDRDNLRVLRTGMWEVVNHTQGTAKPARMTTPGWELCGKTGSAQVQPRPVRYRWTFEYPDGRRQEVFALLESDARALLDDRNAKVVGRHTAERFPDLLEGERLPTHAWFIGWVQPAGTPRGAPPGPGSYAISVIIEYGGSGGRVAGPVAKEIADYLVGGGGTRLEGNSPRTAEARE
ncbi:MAG: hypothetical protein IPM18_00375 [Phycisphaerales bacterium]|nr:hypothetical protein [Phycisphaerales bacterium]